jgi:acetoin utilization deacetylase AcuC-like enzyme
MAGVGFIFDERFLLHDTGRGHPERAERLRAIRSAMQAEGLWDRVEHLPFQAADRRVLERVHAPSYIDRCFAACERGLPYVDSPDSAISRRSAEVAQLAAGASIAAVDAVMSGHVRSAFVACRPPGHHAERDRSMGFCLFNNVALAAEHLIHGHRLDRVAVIDWDVHHGNGTQHSFEHRRDVLVISLHEDPRYQYPGTGLAEEVGRGEGKGYTLNIPLSQGAGDRAIERQFHDHVMPELDEYRPRFVLISAGFDASTADPLGHLSLSEACFGWMTRQLMQVADEHADGRLVSLLEGGYDLHSLGACVNTHLRALLAGAAGSA